MLRKSKDIVHTSENSLLDVNFLPNLLNIQHNPYKTPLGFPEKIKFFKIYRERKTNCNSQKKKLRGLIPSDVKTYCIDRLIKIVHD